MKQILLGLLHTSGINRLARLLPYRHFFVLNFHRVTDRPTKFHEGVIELSPARFRAHVEWLARRVSFVGESDLSSLQTGRRPKVLLTFDDGYIDARENVGPILAKLGVPAIFFVSPGLVDDRCLGAWDQVAYLVKNTSKRDFSFAGRDLSLRGDRTRAYLEICNLIRTSLPESSASQLRSLSSLLDFPLPTSNEMSEEILSWQDVRWLAKQGFAVGGHGLHHRTLSALPIEEQEAEIRQAMQRLSAEGITPLSFAFPYGTPDSYSWESREAALAAGFRYIFSFGGMAASTRKFDPTLIDRVPFKSTAAKYNFLLAFPEAHNYYQRWRGWGAS